MKKTGAHDNRRALQFFHDDVPSFVPLNRRYDSTDIVQGLIGDHQCSRLRIQFRIDFNHVISKEYLLFVYFSYYSSSISY